MKVANECPCGSGLSFGNCCQPFITGKSLPDTAEKLMRSRYSAYATHAIDYLIQTTHASTRKLFSRKEIEKWAKSNKWLKLEVLNSTTTTVEFKAYFSERTGFPQVHHERSNFRFEDGRWYYVDAF